MKSKSTNPLLVTTLLCLLPIVLGLMLYDKLPDQIAVHFNSAGTPDNYLPKAAAVFGLPLVFAFINAYTHFRLDRDPRNENASPRLKQLTKWALPLISLVAMPVTMFLSMGVAIPLGVIIQTLVGLVVVVCGNYLPKCRQNYTVGIKLPWTLNDAENWNKTHRLAGMVWVICGLLLTINAFIQLEYVSVTLLAVMVVLPPVYSFMLYNRQASGQQ